MRAAPLFEEENRNQRLQSKVAPLIAGGKVPVMGGFIGATKSRLLPPLSVGEVPTTRPQLWARAWEPSGSKSGTDCGLAMMTTDPRLVPERRGRIKVISFDEAAEARLLGAKVLHPATVLQQYRRKYSSLCFEFPQSRLRRHPNYCSGTSLHKFLQGHRWSRNASPSWMLQLPPHATGRMAFLSSIFTAFDKHRVAVDVSPTSEGKRFAHRGLERVPYAAWAADLGEAGGL